MPGNMQSVMLRPGVNIEPTAALNEAGISFSQLIRTKNNLTQTVGGWVQLGTTIPSTVRDLHAWQNSVAQDYLAAAATQNLVVQQIVAGSAVSYQDITPQTRSSSLGIPNISISSGSNLVSIIEPYSGLGNFDTVQFITPVSIGNLLLQGAYPVFSIVSTGSFTILSSVVASTTINNGGQVPSFATTAGSNLVVVSQSNHVVGAIQGLQQTFLTTIVPTTIGNINIDGAYPIQSVLDSTQYVIIVPTAASSNGAAAMNGSNAQYLYYVANSAVAGTAGYGSGGYGSGGYGVGITSSGEPGTPITSVDWTMDNWGEILVSCQRDGPIFQWSAFAGTTNAHIISEAPLTNGGCFISMPQQILVVWKSVQVQGNGGFNNGGTQDNLIVRWSDAQDFTQWETSNLTVAGSFHIPTGSVIRGGLQAGSYGVIGTDVDVWLMQFVDATTAFNFTRVGSACGWIGQHAAGTIAGQVMWCGEQNFFMLSEGGVAPLPCTVWDFFFQQLNQNVDANGIPYKRRVYCAPNSAFSEIAWYGPLGDSTENNGYVKFNIVDKTWDYGYLTRTAWEDVSVIGTPVATDTGSIIFQHEMGNQITGAGVSNFRTGWWAISDGEELAFIDWFHPDFNWGTYGNTNASVQITFYSVDYPGDTPRTYGPFTVTQQNPYISPRIRGRLVSMQVSSANDNVFWRLGRCRFRVAPSGKR